MNQKIKNDCEAAELKNQLDDTTKMMVLSMLSPKPQSRYTLASAIGITERTFRVAVRELRQEGHPIVAVSRGKGYKLGTREEALANAMELKSRAFDLLKTAKALEGINPDQLTLDEVMNL